MKSQTSFFPVAHFKAILFRKWTLIRRSITSVLLSLLGTLIFSALAIVIQWLMRTMMKQTRTPVKFNAYVNEPTDFFVVKDADNYYLDFIDNLKELFSEDIKSQCHITVYNTREDANKAIYDTDGTPDKLNYAMGIEISKGDPVKIIAFYNGSSGSSSKLAKQESYAFIHSSRMLWRKNFQGDSDITFSSVKLLRRLSDRIFGQLGPMLITCGLLSIVPMFITQPIIDINGEVRQYMVSCTLRIAPYWAACFLIDLAIWVIVVTLIWAIFLASMIVSFHDNIFNTWYALTFAGPSFILFMYCLLFAFSSAESAPRQAFLIMVLLVLVPVIVQMVRQDSNPVWVDWIFSLIPHIGLQQLLGNILMVMGNMKQDLGYFWKLPNSQPYLIMQFVDIIIYGVILTVIESVRISYQRKKAKKSFGDYHDFFVEAKSKHPVTQEAHDEEDLVHQCHEYAVRIEDVSRLFLNTAGEPIPAVNCVSLGVKEGSLYGFLGANGAGKTTLIRMITGMLPPSDGVIEILGENINDIKDPTILSICPQFNTHLCDELTPREHFKLYSMLFQLNPKDTQSATEQLMKTLELEELADKPIRELSGGDVRKLAIALSFLGPAKIILLDEPTASLDPVARHHVHEMILDFKGQKTFMLCTHLLSEAESLCDTISIMIKGCVYTVGSPQYLTEKFGTEFKIDVMLDDELEETGEKCTQYFEKFLPTAVLSIRRPKARIYSIPAADITLPDLFKVMQDGTDGENGYSYFTCSSSSLERVFMEIVHMSENDDFIVENNEKTTEKAAPSKPSSKKSKKNKETSESSEISFGKEDSKSSPQSSRSSSKKSIRSSKQVVQCESDEESSEITVHDLL